MAKLTLSRKGQLHNTYFLTGSEWLVGSNPACTVRIDSPSILPNHARIIRDGGGHIRYAHINNCTFANIGQIIGAEKHPGMNTRSRCRNAVVSKA